MANELLKIELTEDEVIELVGMVSACYMMTTEEDKEKVRQLLEKIANQYNKQVHGAEGGEQNTVAST